MIDENLKFQFFKNYLKELELTEKETLALLGIEKVSEDKPDKIFKDKIDIPFIKEGYKYCGGCQQVKLEVKFYKGRRTCKRCDSYSYKNNESIREARNKYFREYQRKKRAREKEQENKGKHFQEAE